MSFDLGIFGKEAEKLIRLSLDDPEHPEFASLAFVDRTSRLLLMKEPIRGGESSVTLPRSEDLQHVLTIHTHGDTDTPFSASDLAGLFIPRHEGGIAAGILATPTQELLVLRSPQTPLLSPPEVIDVVLELLTSAAMEEEWSDYQRRYETDGGAIDSPLPLTEEYKQELRQLGHRRMFMLTRAAQEFSLRMYSCPLPENTIHPVT